MNWVTALTLLNSVLLALLLVAGGWVTLRDYFTKRKAAKLEAAAAAAKAKADKIEELVAARLAEVLAAKEETTATETPAETA